jgi:hypothetical protein
LAAIAPLLNNINTAMGRKCFNIIKASKNESFSIRPAECVITQPNRYLESIAISIGKRAFCCQRAAQLAASIDTRLRPRRSWESVHDARKTLCKQSTGRSPANTLENPREAILTVPALAFEKALCISAT